MSNTGQQHLKPALRPAFYRFDGIHNFRDYGGYSTLHGNRLVSNRLFRSGDFSKASGKDLTQLSRLNLSAMIDLRGKKEREKEPAVLSDSFSPTVYCSEGETAINAPALAPHLEGIGTRQSADDMRKEMINRYSTLPFRPYLNQVYRMYFKVLASVNGATVVFCSAGKDRTGLLVALLHSLLGVHHDDIISEFLLTNYAPGQEARIDSLRDSIQKRFGAGLSEDAIRVVTSVEPEYLETAFSIIIERFGSVEAYAREVLCLDTKIRDGLFANLVISRCDESVPVSKEQNVAE